MSGQKEETGTCGLAGHRRGARLCKVLWASERKWLWVVMRALAGSRGAPGSSVWKVVGSSPHTGTALGGEWLRLLEHLFQSVEFLVLLSLTSKVVFIWKHACLICIFLDLKNN